MFNLCTTRNWCYSFCLMHPILQSVYNNKYSQMSKVFKSFNFWLTKSEKQYKLQCSWSPTSIFLGVFELTYLLVEEYFEQKFVLLIFLNILLNLDCFLKSASWPYDVTIIISQTNCFNKSELILIFFLSYHKCNLG